MVEGCARDWILYLRSNSFNVAANELPDVGPFRARQGITPALASCHTALAEGYVIEEHVPVFEVRRLLAKRPHGARGLTVRA